jgi:hypothetical protein
MAKNDEPDMEAEIGYWPSESRMARLDRCRKFLFGQGIITQTVNDAIRTSLEESRDLEYQAVQDNLAESLYVMPPEEGPREGDDPE